MLMMKGSGAMQGLLTCMTSRGDSCSVRSAASCRIPGLMSGVVTPMVLASVQQAS